MSDYRYPPDRFMRFLHGALIVAGVIILLAIAWQVLGYAHDVREDCVDKGGKYIVDRYNRGYCVEVIQ